MEWSKVKNIIILLLLLVNGFLLVLVGMRREETENYQDSALAQAVEVLERSGIQVFQEGLEDALDMSPLSVERNLEREGALAGALLGETVEPKNQGGGLYVYRGNRGEVSIRAGGAISGRMNGEEDWYSQDPQNHAAGLLEEMGVEAEVLESSLDGGTGTVSFRQLWQGAPLFSCQVAFTYEEGSLTGMEGVLLMADPAGAAAGQGETITLPTALLRFLDGILGSGDVCSQILAMEPGYLAEQSFSGSVSLSPVWLVRSNTAHYYLGAVTGELTRAEEI